MLLLILILMVVSSPALAVLHRVGSRAIFPYICQRPCDEILWFINGVQVTEEHENVRIRFSPTTRRGRILLTNLSLEMNGSTIQSRPVKNGKYGALTAPQNLLVEGKATNYFML